MKRYIKAAADDNRMFRTLIRFSHVFNYFESIVKEAGCSRCSYTDYVVRPEDNGGIRFKLEWDGGNISEDDVMNEIETYFGSGIHCNRACGRWDHQITVFVN